MKVLFVLEHFRPYIGGAENLFWALSKELVAKGHEVEVVTTLFRPGLQKEEEMSGIRIFRVRCYNRFLFSFVSLPLVLARAKRADIVHTTSYNAAFPAYFGGLLAKKKVVITFHEVWGKLWWRLPFLSFFQRLAFYSWEQLILRLPFVRFIGVSDFTKKALIQSGIPARKVSRIYNGLVYSDFEAFRHHQTADFSVFYFGRLGVSKGLNLLIPAMGRLVKEHPDARLKLVIPTYPKKLFRHITDQLNQEGLTQNVTLFHDLKRDELFLEACRSSTVVIPSYSEGFCFVAAEATALGIPIVSSQQGALAEVVGGMVSVMEAMTVEALYRALKLAKDKQWQTVPVKQFLLNSSVEGYIDMYNKELSGKEDYR